jgi:hypothetical protein
MFVRDDPRALRAEKEIYESLPGGIGIPRVRCRAGVRLLRADFMTSSACLWRIHSTTMAGDFRPYRYPGHLPNQIHTFEGLPLLRYETSQLPDEGRQAGKHSLHH